MNEDQRRRITSNIFIEAEKVELKFVDEYRNTMSWKLIYDGFTKKILIRYNQEGMSWEKKYYFPKEDLNRIVTSLRDKVIALTNFNSEDYMIRKICGYIINSEKVIEEK